MKKMNNCLREIVESIMKSTRRKLISDVTTTMTSIKGTPIADIERGMEIEERTLIAKIETEMENGKMMLIANIEAEMKNEGMLMADIGRSLESFEQKRKLELQFNKEVSQRILTGEEIKGEGDTPIEVILIDPCTGDVALGGPEASGIVEIVVLKGVGFDACEGDKWFNDNIVQVELGKQPLLVGNVNLKLERGKAVVKGIKFRNDTVNINPPKFRLGARFVSSLFEGTRVKEAKTRVLTVKIYRDKYKRKHDVPSLSDEVWRLRNIQKGGKIQARLCEENITNVKDFLTQLQINPEKLKRIFNLGEKKWDETVNNARACSPGVESARNHPLDSFASDYTSLLDTPGPSEMIAKDGRVQLQSSWPLSGVESARNHPLDSSGPNYTSLLDTLGHSEMSAKDGRVQLQSSWPLFGVESARNHSFDYSGLDYIGLLDTSGPSEMTAKDGRVQLQSSWPLPGVESARDHSLDSSGLDHIGILDTPGPSKMTSENCSKRLKLAQWDKAHPRAGYVCNDDMEIEHGHPKEATNTIAFVDRACLKPDEVGPSGVGCEWVYERLEEYLHIDPFFVFL